MSDDRTIDEKIADFIRKNLSVRHEWAAWEYHGISNTLTTQIILGDEVICECDTRIEIATYDD